MDLADLGKTPWVDRLFQKFLERIARAAPGPKEVPLLRPATKKLSVQEYGCGHYGCAIPTDDSEVVIKVTTDATEAAFAVIAMRQGEQPEGIVRYTGAYAVDFKLKGKPAFVLWRQAAFKVGAHAVFYAGRDDYEKDKLRRFANNLTQYRGIASDVRTAVLKTAPRRPPVDWEQRGRWEFLSEVATAKERAEELIEDSSEIGMVSHIPHGPMRVALELRALELLEEEMQNTAGSDLVGYAVAHYRDIGLLLADTHLNNLGHRAENDTPLRGIIVIDPGHAVALVEKWQSVEIPDLPQ